MSLKLIPINDPAAMRAAGLPFDTEDKARQAERHARRTRNGFLSAFVRIRNQIHINAQRFHELARRYGYQPDLNHMWPDVS